MQCVIKYLITKQKEPKYTQISKYSTLYVSNVNSTKQRALKTSQKQGITVSIKTRTIHKSPSGDSIYLI